MIKFGLGAEHRTSPLENSYSVMPPTAAFCLTPCGRGWVSATGVMASCRSNNDCESKAVVHTADFVAPYVVFDIGGNKYRLIAEINFSRDVLFIRRIMTHKEYLKGAWKES